MPSLDDAGQQAGIVDLDYGDPSSSSSTSFFTAATSEPSSTTSNNKGLAAASNTTASPWSPQEWNEACKLVEELHSFGMSPHVLVERGVNAQVVESCCRALGIPAFSASGSQDENVLAGGGKKKRKGKRARQIEKQQQQQQQEQAAQLAAQQPPLSEGIANGGSTINDEDEVAELARRARATMKANRQSIARSGPPTIEQTGQVEGTPSAPIASTEIHAPPGVSTSALAEISSSVPDFDVKSMRERALASMKRPRSSNPSPSTVSPVPANNVHQMAHTSSLESAQAAFNGQFTAANLSNGHGAQPPEGNSLFPSHPAEPPRRPRSSYHDVDAPDPNGNYDVFVLDDDDLAAAAQEAASSSASASGSQRYGAGGSSEVIKERFRVSYADDDWAPSGEVDYSAPLPSLQAPKSAPLPPKSAITHPSAQASGGRTRRPVAADLIERSSSRKYPPNPPMPFLSAFNHVKIEWSDDEDEDRVDHEGAEHSLLAKQTQAKTDEEMLELFMKGKEREKPAKAEQSSQQREHREDVQATQASKELVEKERAIQALMQRIRQAEARGSKAPAEASTVASMARKAVEEEQARKDDLRKRKATEETEEQTDGVSELHLCLLPL